MAIHSLKDVTKCHCGRFNIRFYTPDELPFDAYISKTHTPLSQLPEGSIIGTSSLRRGAQILSKYPKFEKILNGLEVI